MLGAIVCNSFNNNENNYISEPCRNMYQFCLKTESHPKSPGIKLCGTKRVLLNIFLREHAIFNPVLSAELTDAFRNYLQSQKVIFGLKIMKKP